MGTLGNGRKAEVRALERTGVELICDPSCGPVSGWNEGRWVVGSLETGVKERELRGVKERNGMLSVPASADSQCDRPLARSIVGRHNRRWK